MRESYQHFARTMIDLFWSPRLTRENYSRYIDVVNLELWREELKPGIRSFLPAATTATSNGSPMRPITSEWRARS